MTTTDTTVRGPLLLISKQPKFPNQRPAKKTKCLFQEARSMSPVLYAIFLLQLSSLSTAANFTQVYKWDELDYEWKSEVNKTKALKDGTFNPEKIYPFYMAVYGTRIFLSLASYEGVPVSLVTLPTSSASSAPPKLTPFPSWDINGKKGDCNKIEAAAGLQVDSIGRLWVLDSGSNTCKAKLWITDLINNDQTKLIHRFSFRHNMHDLVLDETPNGTFAYISRINQPIIFVFSLERNESWSVKTPKTRVISIALSPKEEPRKLYLSRFSNSENADGQQRDHLCCLLEEG
ncbi:Hypothetical predicted protein [Cloeon dipterum]|uniref:Bee-milk protein n=1 Tax=Cloeon dipterum TaxID=197152 RepID=A0A8S1DS76_9INSE|nr:Hypothetical predicted protein [Cloeon dipterum]